MRRLRSIVLTVAAAVAVTLVATATPAYAFPVTTFDTRSSNFNGDSVFGVATGSFTWYNRSVGVQGNVCNDVSGNQWTQVEFDFFAGSTDVPPVQTRTVSGLACRSFNFTQGGPVGGISFIAVWLRDSFGQQRLGGFGRP